MAASVAARLTAAWPEADLAVIVVEPTEAPCLFESNRACELTETPSTGHTLMAMLDCQTPSLIAWRVLQRLAHGYLLVGDAEALAAMRLLARPPGRDTAIVAGETGGAGLAGLLAASADPEIRAAMDLGPEARVLIINSEGATAPQLYRRLIQQEDTSETVPDPQFRQTEVTNEPD
jgi:diaminopropionate ammonia-lyase